MKLRAIKSIKQVKIILSGQTIDLNTVNEIRLMYKDKSIYLNIRLEVFSDKEVRLYKDLIERTVNGVKTKVLVNFETLEVEENGREDSRHNKLTCSLEIPEDVELLNLNYFEITTLDYWLKIDNIDDLNI